MEYDGDQDDDDKDQGKDEDEKEDEGSHEELDKNIWRVSMKKR
jgi:hypothetical protein